MAPYFIIKNYMKTCDEILENPLYFNLDMVEVKMPLTYEHLNGQYFRWDDGKELMPFWENNNMERTIILDKREFTYKPINLKKKWYNGESLWFSTIIIVDWKPHNISAFAIAKGGKFFGTGGDKWYRDHSKLVIYGQFLTAIKHEFLDINLLDFCTKYFPDCKEITRLDICSDFACTKPEILQLFDKVTKWESLEYTDPKNPEYFQTYYADKRDREKNLWHLRRIYDKKIEASENTKAYLYPYVSEYDDVQRIEVEMRKGLLDTLALKIDDVFSDEELQKKLYTTYLSSLSSHFERFKFPKTHKVYNPIKLDYLKAIPESYLKYFGSYISRIFTDCSYKWLCQVLLQPAKSTPKFIKKWDTYEEITSSNKKPYWKWTDRTKYKNETLTTVIDPLAFLDVYIRYLHDDIHIPVSKINKVLKNRYIKDTRHERKSKEYDAWFKAFV